MKTKQLKKIVADFIQQRATGSLLLAVSGGPDSLVLLDIFLQLKHSFHVAHVDHQWRAESKQEAENLRRFVEGQGIPFHLKTLDPTSSKGNLENHCREQRRQFFRELSAEHGFQAVLMGHHSNDQAETVLKRCLEGASLSKLSAMAEVSEEAGLTIWRPLLGVPKENLQAYCEEQALTVINDPSNANLKYLRSRQRQQILPYLRETFGKNVHKSLLHIASEAAELQEYLRERIAAFPRKTVSGPIGSYLDLSASCPEAALEIKALLKEVFSDLKLSKPQWNQVVQALQDGHGNKRFLCAGQEVVVDRKRLFLFPKQPQPWSEELKLEPGEHRHGPWVIRVSNAGTEKRGWEHAWKGELCVALPPGSYALAPAKKLGKLDRLWTREKVPAFLRSIFPVIRNERGEICTDFLSEHSLLISKPILGLPEKGLYVSIRHGD